MVDGGAGERKTRKITPAVPNYSKDRGVPMSGNLEFRSQMLQNLLYKKSQQGLCRSITRTPDSKHHLPRLNESILSIHSPNTKYGD